MPQKHLPPLEADTTYRVSDFEYLEFLSQDFHQSLTGEDKAILHFHLANKTKLEMPLTDKALQQHMYLLMSAYPTKTLEFLQEQPWAKKYLRDSS